MSLKTIFVLKHCLKKVLGHTLLLNAFLLSFLLTSNSYGANAAWYRYYDKQGVANISSTVSPEHIRYGYETLDSNMLVIKKVKPSQGGQSALDGQQREQSYLQHKSDMRIKGAYSNPKFAETKKKETLKGTQDQITFQKKQLNNLYQIQANLKKQEQDARLQGRDVSKLTKDALEKNAIQIANTQRNIIYLQTNYQRTEQHYDYVISRLKALEEIF